MVYKKIKEWMKKSEFFLHETKRFALGKFSIILLIVLGYFIFVTIEFGLGQGFFITILTWSFFVLCTPVADAGFLFDFPTRLITKIRMIYSEICIWIAALILNWYFLRNYAHIYDKVIILKLFKSILQNPSSFWSIMILSAIGTFLSIYFGDELLDTMKHAHRKKHQKHKNKLRLIFLIFILILITVVYRFLMKEFGMPKIIDFHILNPSSFFLGII